MIILDFNTVYNKNTIFKYNKKLYMNLYFFFFIKKIIYIYNIYYICREKLLIHMLIMHE